MTQPAADASNPSTLRPSVPDADRERRRRRHLARHHVLRWVKRVVLVAAAVGVATVVILAWLPDPVPVDDAGVARVDVDVTVEEDGLTRVRERYVVAAPLSGYLLRVDVEPGDAVDTGAVLARIVPLDPALLDRRTRAEAQARLEAAIARRRQSDTGARRAADALASAQREADRARDLSRRGVIAAAELDRAELAERLARADASAADLDRRVAAADVASARAAVGRLASGVTDELVVTAPSAGRVLRVMRESEGPVAAGTALLEVGDPRAMEAVIDVLSSDAARVHPGDPVSLTGWGDAAELTGRVRLVEPSAFTRVSALGVEEQRVNVVVALDAAPAELGDGYRVEAAILVAHVERALAVPAGAVFRDRRRWAVYAIEDGRAALRVVEIGERGGDLVEVRSGLAEGDRVVLHPGDRVRPGARVVSR